MPPHLVVSIRSPMLFPQITLRHCFTTQNVCQAWFSMWFYTTAGPLEFLNCSEPEERKENKTVDPDTGIKFGCTKWGGEKYEDVERTKVWCQPLQGVTCYGKQKFLKDGFPCIKYTGHYFVTTLIYSVLLGFLGMDRFCLGHTGTAVGKLLTLGGVGIWWIVDIVLLVTGVLRPVDGSNWEPYY